MLCYLTVAWLIPPTNPLGKGSDLLSYEEPGYAGLGVVGRWSTVGRLAHPPAVLAFSNPTTNSYKRLVPGYEAPVNLVYSQRNRSAAVRIPLYSQSPKAKRLEFRCPDPSCNPYLCFAGMLHAGLEGIEKGYELPEPMEQNLYHLTPEERAQRGIEQLPETLGEAIEIAAESELVLRVLGEHTFKRFVEIKREEWEEYRVQVTPWELDRYLAIL